MSTQGAVGRAVAPSSRRFPVLSRVLIYVALGTAILAEMDWQPIHYQWWHYGQLPGYAQNYSGWMGLRSTIGTVLCPPCLALSENAYYVLMENEAGTEEQQAVLKVPYSGDPLLPAGPYSWRGQGPGRPWRPVSLLSWYLYWLPATVLWWWLYASDLFRGRLPWSLRAILSGANKVHRKVGRVHSDAALNVLRRSRSADLKPLHADDVPFVEVL
jgi:hypothetical protein